MSAAAALEGQYFTLLDSIIDTVSNAELPASQMFARTINPDLAALSNPIPEVHRHLTTFHSEYHTHLLPLFLLMSSRDVSTLDIKSAVLTINGNATPNPILDTGARHVMLGASYANHLGLTNEKLLPGTHYVTASQVTKKTMGITKEKIPVTLRAPDGRQTTIMSRLHTSTSNHFSVIIGNAILFPTRDEHIRAQFAVPSQV